MSGSQLAYLPFYVRDWWSDPEVLALTWLERKVYLDMLMLSWEWGPLVHSPCEIVRAIGWDGVHTSRRFKVETCVAKLLASFFQNGKNKRLELERERAFTIGEVNSDRAYKAARKRWDAHARSIAQASSEQCSSNARGCQSQAQAQDSAPTVSTPPEQSGRAERAGTPPGGLFGKERPRKQKPDQPGTPQAELVAWFAECWAFYRHDLETGEPIPYLPAPGTEYIAAAKLLKAYARDQIEERAQNMLELEDSYHHREASLRHLLGDWVKFAVRPVERNGRAV